MDEREKMNCIETAFVWHGGISSALYSLASTRQLWSENHREDAIKEVDRCLIWQEGNPEQEAGDLDLLLSLREKIILLPVGKVLPCPY